MRTQPVRWCQTVPDLRSAFRWLRTDAALVGMAGVAVVLLMFADLGRRELYSSHEARAAQNAQRMLDSGDWSLPVLFDGRIDLQKPPGYYWAVAVVGRLNSGRVSEWVVRFPAALAGFLCVVLLYAHLRAEGRPTAALVAALMLATATHFLALTRTARIDVPLACMVQASVLAFVRGCRGYPLPWHLVSALAAGWAVLLKGPVALALIGPATGVWYVVERCQRPLRLPLVSLLLGPAVVAGVALPWFLWADGVTDGEFGRVFFWHHTIARYAGTSPLLASHPFWYYLPRLAFDLLPWTPVLLILKGWAARHRLWSSDPEFRLGVVAAAVMVLVLSTARFKRADYLLPAYPFVAMGFGSAAAAWWQTRSDPGVRRAARYAFLSLLGVAGFVWLVMTRYVEPRQQDRQTMRAFAEVIRRHAPPPQLILQFRFESHLLSYHLGPPLHTLVEWEELDEWLARPGPQFVVMPPEYVYATSLICRSRRLVEVIRLAELTPAPPHRPLVLLRTE